MPAVSRPASCRVATHSELRLADTRRLSHGRAYWRLLVPFRHERPGVRVVVPAGFLTDFASVPRFLWPIFPPTGPWQRAAVVHDWLYTRAADCPRFLADALFRDAMQAAGVPAWRRVAAYYAVRCFGWLAYRGR